MMIFPGNELYVIRLRVPPRSGVRGVPGFRACEIVGLVLLFAA